MTVEAVHSRIRNLANENGITTRYGLVKCSGISRSTIYNMFANKNMPSIENLEKICIGLNVTLSDFFSVFSEPHVDGYITEDDRLLIEANRALNQRNQVELLGYARGLLGAQQRMDE